MGAHTSYNTYASLLDLINQEQCIDQMEKKGKGSFKLYEGGFISMLRKLNVLELITHLAKMPWTNKSGKTISEYYSKVLGKKNYDAVFNHMFSALLSQNAKNFPAEMLFKKRKAQKEFPKKFNFKNGMSTIILQLARDLNIKKGFEVSRIFKQGNEYILESGKDHTNAIAAKFLVFATPPSNIKDIISSVEPQLSELLKQFGGTDVESFAIRVSKTDTVIPEMAGAIGIEQEFYSIISMDPYNITEQKSRSFVFHFKPNLLSSQQKFDTILKVMNLSQDQVLDKYEKITTFPIIPLNYKELVKQIADVSADRQLTFIGNYFDGTSIEDCIQRAKKEFNRLDQSGRFQNL